MQVFDDFSLFGYSLQNAQLLGSGSYGKVYRVYSNKRKEEVALKQINMEKIREQHLEQLLKREIHLMKQFKSDNTLELIEDQMGETYTYIVLELCEEDLRKKMINSPHRFPQSQVIEIFGDIVKGFKIMVDNSCIHRDIKPQNVLCKKGVYKLADFGFACKADVYGENKMMEYCGTPIYMAPQLLFNQPYTAKCDIWSLGLMLFELIYGATPWPVRCIDNYKQTLLKRPLAFPFNVKIGKQTKDFLKKTLVVNQDDRMSWKQLFDHPLVKDKLCGDTVKQKSVSNKIKKILSLMQREADRNFVDIIDVFKKYKTQKGLDYQNFQTLLRQLNPTITTYQIKTLFKAGDEDQNGFIDQEQFEQLFCSTNFRSDLVEERQLDQIIGIIVAKNIDVEEMFDKFDVNGTKALDWKEFCQMIYFLAPKYRVDQINVLYKILDFKKDGRIQKDEILKVIGYSLMNRNNQKGIWKQRAERNTKTLKLHLQERQMDATAMLVTADINVDKHIDLDEFLRLMEVIDFDISIPEAKQMFKLIDQNCSEKISFAEISSFLE